MAAQRRVYQLSNSWTATPVRLPIIDRLFDDPNPPRTRAESVRRLKKALERDLEWLLNTRRPAEDLSPAFSEVEKSAYWYGLPDLNSLSLSSEPDRAGLIRAIQTAIATFEPRLTSVRVSLSPVAEEGLPELRFVIDALLRMEPVPEHVSFDTVLDVADGEYRVRGQAGE